MNSLLRWLFALALLLALGTWLPRPTPPPEANPLARVPHGLHEAAIYQE